MYICSWMSAWLCPWLSADMHTKGCKPLYMDSDMAVCMDVLIDEMIKELRQVSRIGEFEIAGPIEH